MSEISDRIIEIVRNQPQITVFDMALEVPCSPTSIQFHLKKLRRTGRLHCTRDENRKGRPYVYRVNDEMGINGSA